MREPMRFVANPHPRGGGAQAGASASTTGPGPGAGSRHGTGHGATVGPFPEPDAGSADQPPSDTSGSGTRTAGDCLLVTRDEALADHVALVAAAAGAILHVARAPSLGRPDPGGVILLGPDAADAETAQRGAGTVIMVGYAESEDGLWKAAARRPGARVAVLPRAAAWLGEFLGELGLRRGPGRVLLVAGTAGGAGTTTVAALTAAAATLEGQRTLLIDADPHSPGLWPMLRPAASGTVGWEDLALSRGQVAPSQLAEILPVVQGMAVLTWADRSPSGELPGRVLGEVVAASRRIFDAVVVDAGRVAGLDASLVAVADLALAVVPSRSVASPGWFPDPAVDALRWQAVVTGRLPAGADAARIASASGLEAAGFLPDLRAIRNAAADGRLLSCLGRRNVRAMLRPLVAACRASAVAPRRGLAA